MNYKKVYEKIINNRINNPIQQNNLYLYTEKHHIIPRSVGGTDDKSNVIILTAREHFICHLLLTKMYNKNTSEWFKMIKAFSYMYTKNKKQCRYSNNKWYEYLRINLSITQSIKQSGCKNSRYGTCWISNTDEKKCISIDKIMLEEYLNKGWIKKRIVDWNKFENDINTKTYKKKKEEERILECKCFYNNAYKYYDMYGWKATVKKYKWKKSWAAFVMMCKKYCDDFISKNHTTHTRGKY